MISDLCSCVNEPIIVLDDERYFETLGGGTVIDKCHLCRSSEKDSKGGDDSKDAKAQVNGVNGVVQISQ